VPLGRIRRGKALAGMAGAARQGPEKHNMQSKPGRSTSFPSRGRQRIPETPPVFLLSTDSKEFGACRSVSSPSKVNAPHDCSQVAPLPLHLLANGADLRAIQNHAGPTPTWHDLRNLHPRARARLSELVLENQPARQGGPAPVRRQDHPLTAK